MRGPTVTLKSEAVFRATGLAQSLAALPDEFRADGVREIGAEIITLLVDNEVARAWPAPSPGPEGEGGS